MKTQRMYRDKGQYVLILITALFMAGCTETTTDQPATTGDTTFVDTSAVIKDTTPVTDPDDAVKLFDLSEDDKATLSLVDQINGGFSYNEVKEKYPTLKGIRPEEKKDELAAEGYTESVNKKKIFGKGEASSEFNFKDDSLYSFLFTYNEKDSERAEMIFQSIKKFYSEKFGEPQRERVEEENHYSQNFIWSSKGNFVIYLNFNLNTNTLVWGRRYEKTL